MTIMTMKNFSKKIADLFVDRNGDFVPLQRLLSRDKICALTGEKNFPNWPAKFS